GLCMLIRLRLAGLALQTKTTFAQALQDLAAELNKAKSASLRQDQVIVPADGIHMEPVAGSCVLDLERDEASEACEGEFNWHGHIQCKDSTRGKDKDKDKEKSNKKITRSADRN